MKTLHRLDSDKVTFANTFTGRIEAAKAIELKKEPSIFDVEKT